MRRICARLAFIAFASSSFAQSSITFDAKESLPTATVPTESGKLPRGKLIFKVVQLSGTVQYQPPLGAEWHKVRKGQNLRDGILLQVSKDSEIALDSEDSLGREGLPVKKSRITISAATIVRLSRDSFRKVQMSQQMIRALPDMDSLKKLEFLTKALRSMKDAWKQDASMLMGKDWIDNNALKMLSEALRSKTAKDPVSITASVGKINLTAPHDKQITIAKNLPTDLNLKWERSDAGNLDNASYTVYFWKKGDPMLPYGVSKGNQYSVKVHEAGTYFAQISSVDGGYRSEIKSVKIEFDRDQKKKNAEPEEGGHDDPLGEVAKTRVKAIAPDKNLVWYGKGNWPVLGFEWTKPIKCTREARFKFEVRDDARKTVFEMETDKTTLNWEPDPTLSGDLSWFVRVKGCVGEDNKVVAISSATTPRRVTLVHATPHGSILSRITAPKFRGTIVLDEF